MLTLLLALPTVLGLAVGTIGLATIAQRRGWLPARHLAGAMQITAQVALGPGSRVVLVDVGGRSVLLGVTRGQITRLDIAGD